MKCTEIELDKLFSRLFDILEKSLYFNFTNSWAQYFLVFNSFSNLLNVHIWYVRYNPINIIVVDKHIKITKPILSC